MKNKILLLFFAMLLTQCNVFSKSKKKYSKKIKFKKGKRGFNVFAKMPSVMNIQPKPAPAHEQKKNIELIESFVELEQYKKALEEEQSYYAAKLKEVEKALQEVEKQTSRIKTREAENITSQSKITEITDDNNNNEESDDDDNNDTTTQSTIQ